MYIFIYVYFIYIKYIYIYTCAVQFGLCSPPRVLDAFHDVVGLLDVGTAAGPRAWQASRYCTLHGFCGTSKSESLFPNFLQWSSFRFHVRFQGDIIAGLYFPGGKSVVRVNRSLLMTLFGPFRSAAPRSKAA